MQHNQNEISSRQAMLKLSLERSAKQVVTSNIVVDIDWSFMSLNLKERYPNYSAFNVISYCIVQAMQKNTLFRSEILNELTMRVRNQIDFGFAVHCPNNDLVIAVVENANSLQFESFAEKQNEAIKNAYLGSNFKLSNVPLILTYLADYNVTSCFPIVVSPSISTIAVCSPFQRDNKLYSNLIVGFDHRYINGVGAAKFGNQILDEIRNFFNLSNSNNKVNGNDHSKIDLERDDLAEIITLEIASDLGILKSDIDKGKSLHDYGLTSSGVLECANKLSILLKKQIPLTIFWNFPTIRSLINQLTEFAMKGQSLDENQGLLSTDKALDKIYKIVDNKLSLIERNELQKILNNLAVQNNVVKTNEEIAIVGISCRFPLSPNIECFWENILEQKECISTVSEQRWNPNLIESIDPKTLSVIKKSGFLSDDDWDYFDYEFFKIPKAEAFRMDPQQRIILKLCWEALEQGGFTKSELKQSKCGVFIGIHSQSCDAYIKQTRNLKDIDFLTGINSANNVIAGRIPYFLDSSGPAITFDTACSSSLVALHFAIRSLKLGECDIAIVGGVNAINDPAFSLALSKMHILSPDGRCKAFDKKANGFVRGEGAGVIVLMRKKDAEDQKRFSWANIAGSSINHDGTTNGIAAPNGIAQENVILSAMKDALISPNDIGYLEAHGTGTSVGDRIEIEAIKKVFSEKVTPLFVGSAKTNIGHLEGASGIAGLIKCVLAIHHKCIPPSVNYGDPIDLEKSCNIVLPSAIKPWLSDKNLYAGVSSFGWSGTNSHIIIRSADTYKPSETTYPELMILTGTDQYSLEEFSKGMLTFLKSNEKFSISDICHTTRLRRTQFQKIRCLVECDKNDFIKSLSNCHYNENPELLALPTIPKLNLAIGECSNGIIATAKIIGNRFKSFQTILNQFYSNEMTFIKNHVATLTHEESYKASILESAQVDIAIIAFLKFFKELLGDFEITPCCSKLLITHLFQNKISLNEYIAQIVDRGIITNGNYTIKENVQTLDCQPINGFLKLDVFESKNKDVVIYSTELLTNGMGKELLGETNSNSNLLSLFLRNLGQLYEKGINVNWEFLFESQRLNIVPLPNYKFKKTICRKD